MTVWEELIALAECGCFDCPCSNITLGEMGLGRYRVIPSQRNNAVLHGGSMEKPIEPTLENYEQFYNLPVLEDEPGAEPLSAATMVSTSYDQLRIELSR